MIIGAKEIAEAKNVPEYIRVIAAISLMDACGINDEHRFGVMATGLRYIDSAKFKTLFADVLKDLKLKLKNMETTITKRSPKDEAKPVRRSRASTAPKGRKRISAGNSSTRHSPRKAKHG